MLIKHVHVIIGSWTLETQCTALSAVLTLYSVLKCADLYPAHRSAYFNNATPTGCGIRPVSGNQARYSCAMSAESQRRVKEEEEQQSTRELRMFSWEDVKRHNTAESAWVVVHDKVYDVTQFLDEVRAVARRDRLAYAYLS